MDKKLTILYHILNPTGTGADRWIYEGWKDAFVDLGYQFCEVTAFDDFSEKLRNTSPDIFMTAMNLISKDHLPTLNEMRNKGGKVFMWSHWPAVASCSEIGEYMINNDIADIYFGEREPEGMVNFEEIVGKQYHVLPNAANKKLHYPAKPVTKYQYDIVYLGSKLPMKKWFFDEVLIPLTKKYNVGIFGPNWTFKDNLLRFGVKILRTINFKSGVDILNKYRILIPADEENQLYSSAKICLNFHEREADGSQPHYILNQRTFKIPACGGFQICDEIPAIRRYFNKDELVTAAYDPKDWFDKISYFMSHDTERKQVQAKGAQRALKDHTYHNRVNQVIELYRGL